MHLSALSTDSAKAQMRAVWTTVAVIVATMVFLVIGVCALPHDRYLRFKSSTDSEFAKFGWIYERIHFDRRPIDVAIFGTSRTMLGIDSALVEQSFADASGRAVEVVNFSHADWGRELDYLTARELIQTARPQMLLIEVNETEGATVHEGFGLLAEPSDLLEASMLVDPRYLSDLLRLPSRQLSLFARTTAPELFSDSKPFDKATYRGPHWDNPELEFRDHGLFLPVVYAGTSSESELEADERNKARAKWAPNPHLPLAIQSMLRQLKNRTSLIWLQKLLDLAQQASVSVRFLYVPAWRDHAGLAQADFYRRHAPTWSYPGDIDRVDWWYDSKHLNRNGSIVFSEWLGRRMADDLRDEGSSSAQ